MRRGDSYRIGNNWRDDPEKGKGAWYWLLSSYCFLLKTLAASSNCCSICSSSANVALMSATFFLCLSRCSRTTSTGDFFTHGLRPAAWDEPCGRSAGFCAVIFSSFLLALRAKCISLLFNPELQLSNCFSFGWQLHVRVASVDLATAGVAEDGLSYVLNHSGFHHSAV